MLGGANAAAVGRAQNHRTAEPSLRAIAQPGRMVHQLIDAGIDESHKLDLADRPEALRSHTDAQATDQQFGERRIDHALRSETLLQADGGTEDTAIDPDVFTQNDNAGIITHGAGERQVDCFDQRHFSHVTHPSARDAEQHRPLVAPRRGGRIWSLVGADSSPNSAQSPLRSAAGTRPQAALPPLCPRRSDSQDMTLAARSAPLSSALGPPPAVGIARHHLRSYGRRADKSQPR